MTREEVRAKLKAVPLTWSGCFDPTRHTHHRPPDAPDYDALTALVWPLVQTIEKIRSKAGDSVIYQLADDALWRLENPNATR